MTSKLRLTAVLAIAMAAITACAAPVTLDHPMPNTSPGGARTNESPSSSDYDPPS